MSTFKGFLSDPNLRFIAIDYFGPSTYSCRSFMLSHVHWDHLYGLFDSEFISSVNNSTDKYLYCSSFTAHLLSKFPKFGIRADRIVAMDVNQSYLLRSGIETDVAVACLPAGHCPGSAMFLFEYKNKRLLYTGDFRIRINELRKIKNRLTNDDGTVIPIDELYLDSTFATPSILNDFPSRESSEKFIIGVIESWLREFGPEFKIKISLPYRFGIEFLYLSLSKKFGKPISVHDFDSYAQVEDIMNHVISFEDAADEAWFIHACIRKKCNFLSRKNVKILRPCAISFLKKSEDSLTVDSKFNVPYDEKNGIFRFFYSSHCSLKELQDIVEYLQPGKIYPNVNSNELSEKEMINLIYNKDSNGNPAAGDSLMHVLKESNNTMDIRLSEEKKKRLETMKKFNLRT